MDRKRFQNQVLTFTVAYLNDENKTETHTCQEKRFCAGDSVMENPNQVNQFIERIRSNVGVLIPSRDHTDGSFVPFHRILSVRWAWADPEE